MFLRSPKHFKVGKQFLYNTRNYFSLKYKLSGTLDSSFFYKYSVSEKYNYLLAKLNYSFSSVNVVKKISIRSKVRIKFF